MGIEKVFLLGISNAVKPRVIIENLKQNQMWNEKKFIFLTDTLYGETSVYCRNLNIEVIEFNEKFIDEALNNEEIKDALLISIGWSYILTPKTLNIFKECINCHGGLLPDFRGNNTYMHSYAALEEYYGTTIHYMSEEFDGGNILTQGRLKSYIDETPEIMHRRICEVTAYLIPESIKLVEEGFLGKKQTGQARYFNKISREEMDSLRQENIKNLEAKSKIRLPKHKEWDI